MKRFSVSLLSLCLLAILVGCTGDSTAPDDGYTVTLLPGPDLNVGTADVVVSILDQAGEPVTTADVTLEGTMTHAGMMPSNATTTEIAPGQYQGALDLTMGGEWLVIVRAELPSGETIERTLPLGDVAP